MILTGKAHFGRQACCKLAVDTQWLPLFKFFPHPVLQALKGIL